MQFGCGHARVWSNPINRPTLKENTIILYFKIDNDVIFKQARDCFLAHKNGMMSLP